MSNLFFTSDTHFSHKLVAGLRGFSSTEDHDEALIRNWNSVVSHQDTVIHLGDVSLKHPEVFYKLILRLNGSKHLIAGNNDYCFPGNRESYKYQGLYYPAFLSIQSFARRKIAGKNVLLSHFPYTGDHGPDRYTQYRLRDEGLPLIHGHTHGSEKFSLTEKGTLQIHAGLDAWNLRPVPVESIENLIIN